MMAVSLRTFADCKILDSLFDKNDSEKRIILVLGIVDVPSVCIIKRVDASTGIDKFVKDSTGSILWRCCPNEISWYFNSKRFFKSVDGSDSLYPKNGRIGFFTSPVKFVLGDSIDTHYSTPIMICKKKLREDVNPKKRTHDNISKEPNILEAKARQNTIKDLNSKKESHDDTSEDPDLPVAKRTISSNPKKRKHDDKSGNPDIPIAKRNISPN